MDDDGRFITEIPLIVDKSREAALSKRFEAARQAYNACLDEALRRADLMRESKDWRMAGRMNRGPEKNATYRGIRERYDFRSKYDLQKYAQQFGRSWIGHHIDSQTMKQIATRAFTWVEQWIYDPQRGRPKFRKFGQLNAVESINNTQGITYRNNLPDGPRIVWSAGRNGKTLVLPAMVDPDDPVMMHGLTSEMKYVRLVRREINGVYRFYAQLVCAGKPYQRFSAGHGVVGLDIGPSTVAIVAKDKPAARLKLFCEELADRKAEERRLQRKTDRQRRANNPDNYNPDGTIKRGIRLRWEKSNRQRQTEIRLREVRRKLAEHRKSLHGQLVNEIVQMGDVIKLEKLSYVAFQRIFGKSVGVRAPGQFVARLKQKIGDCDGIMDEFSTYSTKLSQVDHQTGEYTKKPLSQRWHVFEDNTRIQRDLYSAFLAACVEDDRLNVELANQRWQHVKPVLEVAVADCRDMDKRPTSFGF